MIYTGLGGDIVEDKKQLSEEARKKRNEYMKEYRNKNKLKIAEYQRKYWERKAMEELKENKGVK